MIRKPWIQWCSIQRILWVILILCFPFSILKVSRHAVYVESRSTRQFCKGIQRIVQEHKVVTQKVYWDYCISVLTICFCYHRELSAWAIRLINRLLINIVKILTFFTVDLKAKAEVVKGITVLMKFKKQNKKILKT